MPQSQVIAPLELIMNRTFNAPRERVFRAWTEAGELNRWFKPDPEAKVTASVDLRVGGAYRIDMVQGDRNYGAFGTYREIRPPERLVFTWTALNCGDTTAEDTLVTVEFFDADGKTQVTLTHQHFPTSEVRDRHNSGWNACFERLKTIL
jgi:uncharacterized protein YndB with AHSA1/START domain